MGYIRPNEVDQVDLPTKGYWVKMRGRVIGRDHSLALATAIEEVPDPAASGQRWLVQNQVLAVQLLVEWNITDENDKPLPINRETLGDLDPADHEQILMEANRRRVVRSEEHEAPFVKRSSTRSKASK